MASIEIPQYVKVIGDQVFFGCSSLTQIRISDQVETIGAEAFRDCLQLSEISISDSVVSIGENAFVGCRNLKIIRIEALTPPECPSLGLHYWEEGINDWVEMRDVELEVPEDSVEAYLNAKGWGDYLRRKRKSSSAFTRL